MKMFLKRLEINNFKGAVGVDIDFGCTTEIYAENGKGKTRAFDAYCWLLFGKNSHGEAAFEAKPLDSNNNVIHHQDVSVIGYFELNGEKLKLERRLIEDWGAKGIGNGKLRATNTECYVDNVLYLVSAFDKYVESLGSQKQLIIATNPLAFLNLHWKDARTLLFELYRAKNGNFMGDDEFIAQNSELAGLKLGGKTADLVKQRLEGQRKNVKKQLADLPARLDEAKKAINTPSIPLEEAEARAADVSNQLLADDGTATYRKEVERLKSLLTTKQREVKNLSYDAKRDHKVKLDKLLDEKASVVREIDKGNRLLRDLKAENEKLIGDIDAAKSIDVHISTDCPTCERPLELADVNNALANAEKAKIDRIGQLREEKRSIAKKYEDIKVSAVALEEALANIVAAIVDLESQAPVEASTDTAKLEAEIAKYEAAIAVGKSADRAPLGLELKEMQAIVASYRHNEAQQLRADELKSQLTAAQVEMEEIEQQLILLDLLSRLKNEQLENSINELFRFTKFKLFKSLISGGFEDTCVATHNGIPITSHNLNTGHKVLVALEISAVFAKFFNLEVPIFIDNMESVTARDFSTLAGNVDDRQLVMMIAAADVPQLEIRRA